MPPDTDARPTHGRAAPDLRYVLDHARSLELRVYSLNPHTWAWLHGRLQWQNQHAAAVVVRQRMADFTLDVFSAN